MLALRQDQTIEFNGLTVGSKAIWMHHAKVGTKSVQFPVPVEILAINGERCTCKVFLKSKTEVRAVLTCKLIPTQDGV